MVKYQFFMNRKAKCDSRCDFLKRGAWWGAVLGATKIKSRNAVWQHKVSGTFERVTRIGETLHLPELRR